MSYSISITKRTNGGYTVVTEDHTSYPSHVIYHGTEDGVILFSRGLTLLRFYRPAEWTIQSATNFTTVAQVTDALDALGISATEGTDDIEALLTTIDADTGAAVDRLKEVAGQDFLMITDTAAHATLDCTMIYVMADAVFANITVAAADVVAAKGLTGVTVTAGTLLPFGKAHATAITLTSGKVIAYIN
jgi:hypothetical protein